MVKNHPEKDLQVVCIGVGLAILVAIYAAVKPYPTDTDAAGRVLVEGAKMANDTFKGVGWSVAFLTGWILERRLVRFSTNISMMKRITRLTFGLLSYYIVSLIFVPVIKDWISGAPGTFVSCYLQILYVSFIFPWMFKHFENICPVSTGKKIIPLYFTIISVFLLTACSNRLSSETAVSGEQETVKVEIKIPSDVESTIAPGRHFKVSGSLSGEIPDDANLRVMLLDAAGNEMRYAAADQKGTERVIPSVIGDDITVFNKDTDFSEVAYTAPELVVADINDPYGSAYDATVKCVYTDNDFYALIVSATDPEHGLAESDGFELVDHEGRPYDALPEGKYQIHVTLSSPDGKELASTSREIEIGRKEGTIIHEITSKTAFEKGGKDLLIAWVSEENLTILDDLLPGFFGTFYQMSFMPMSVSCETAEYLPDKIHMLVYGNRASSTSNALEVARYLQLEHNAENPDIVKYYLFDLGEPAFAGEQAKIIAFDDNENIRICRIDRVKENTSDGVFLTTEEQVLDSDTDPSDDWEATEGAFAIAGVMKPYQLQDDEIVPDNDIFSYYRLLNGADSLVYTFTPSDGSDPFSITKAVGVTRIDEPDGESTPALYEFYNVFPENTLMAGNSYDVTIQAFDKKGAEIKGAVCTFTISANVLNSK